MPDMVQQQSEIDEELGRRICAEYRELPGLQLTIAQACRLWSADRNVGRQTLDALVEAAFLRRCGEHYVRADAGYQRNWH